MRMGILDPDFINRVGATGLALWTFCDRSLISGRLHWTAREANHDVDWLGGNTARRPLSLLEVLLSRSRLYHPRDTGIRAQYPHPMKENDQLMTAFKGKKIVVCGYHWIGCKAVEIFQAAGANVYVYTHPAGEGVPCVASYCRKAGVDYTLERISASNLPFTPGRNRLHLLSVHDQTRHHRAGWGPDLQFTSLAAAKVSRLQQSHLGDGAATGKRRVYVPLH